MKDVSLFFEKSVFKSLLNWIITFICISVLGVTFYLYSQTALTLCCESR